MPNEHIQGMRDAHEILTKFNFEIVELNKGYANRTLRIDLDSNEITECPVTQQMKDLWTGGKGFDLWMMFHHLVMATYPLLLNIQPSKKKLL